MTTLMQILGWIEHCERELPDKATVTPVWLCSWEAFEEAIAEGYVKEKGSVSLIPRWGMSQIIYGLTDKGRLRFYEDLPRAGCIQQRAP